MTMVFVARCSLLLKGNHCSHNNGVLSLSEFPVILTNLEQGFLASALWNLGTE